MRVVKILAWVAVALLGAFAIAVVSRIFWPDEPINSVWLLVAAACTFLLAYRFYGAFIAAKVFALDDRNITPAVRLADGRDYHATNRWILFGHHFAAIAGAGPLIGPVLAAQFGYMPGALWILLGAVFAGAVHDFVVLVASVRHDGRSLAEIAGREIGPLAGVAASVATLFILIVTLAGFGLSVVNALAHSPWGTFTIFLTIPIALLMGLYLYKIRPGKIAETTVIGVSLLILAVVAGHEIIGTQVEPWFTLQRNSLVLAIALYGLVASSLPVWMLLCPRDYLSTYMKIGTITMLAIGILVLAPEIKMPSTTIFIHGGGPVIPGTVFPFVFITIACGAVSGFHSLVASGTTPKMVSHETEIRAIGFGAMLVEGFVSMMALIAASILIPGDYFAINSTLSVEALTKLGFAPQRIAEFSAMVGTNVAGRPGGAVSLAVGMASVFAGLPGMRHLMAYWYNYALMFEALFILTALDTGTRVARFLVQEIASRVYKPLTHNTLWLTWAASLVVVTAWGWLIYTGSISTIWPMFGVSNQLLASLALAVGTTVILRMGKARYAPITLVPMAFMAVTTLTAAVELIVRFLGDAAAKPAQAFTLRLDSVLVGIMACLAIIIFVDAISKWIAILRGAPAAQPAAHAPSPEQR